jgi:D-methionine transport system ATP-binding protein
LCDEATSALDPKTTESILRLLKRVNQEMGVTILLITHQMQVIQMICNKVAVMENGQVVEQGSVMEVFSRPQAPVTQEFVRTVINDQIPGSIVELLQTEKRNYRVDRLKFIGSNVKRPVISEICRTEGVEVNILGATVQELEDSVMCIFILQLIGPEEQLEKAEQQIDDAGVLRERLVLTEWTKS